MLVSRATNTWDTSEPPRAHKQDAGTPGAPTQHISELQPQSQKVQPYPDTRGALPAYSSGSGVSPPRCAKRGTHVEGFSHEKRGNSTNALSPKHQTLLSVPEAPAPRHPDLLQKTCCNTTCPQPGFPGTPGMWPQRARFGKDPGASHLLLEMPTWGCSG